MSDHAPIHRWNDAVVAAIGDEPLARDLSEMLTSVRAASRNSRPGFLAQPTFPTT